MPASPPTDRHTASHTATNTADDDAAIAEFHDAVNMTAAELKRWLDTERSHRVGFKGGGTGESVGHHSGRRIVELLGKKRAELTEADIEHMRKVVGFVHRHLAQRPHGDISDTPWRFSLMNWGHDPS